VSRRDQQRLEDISAAIRAITAHLQRGDLTDGLVFDAVRVRLIEIGALIFNALIVGTDAHAKNYSFLLAPGQVRLHHNTAAPTSISAAGAVLCQAETNSDGVTTSGPSWNWPSQPAVHPSAAWMAVRMTP